VGAVSALPDFEALPDEYFTSLDTTRAALQAAVAEQRRADALAPAVGDPAPDFSLPRLLADRSLGAPIRLSTLRGRPVALLFGSYT
jgi:hypothetical protein